MIDVAVVRERLSAYHGTRVPRSVARFVAWLAEDPSHVEQLEERANLLPTHDLAIAGTAAPLPVRSNFRYHNEPPEFIAFAQTGNDGEHIGVLELAPELERDELPFVTFFPADFTLEVCPLGDDLGTALAMFLAYPSVEGPRPLELPGLFDEPLPAATWHGYAPPSFDAPDGYRFVQTADRAGVLAPVDAFSGEIPSIASHAETRELQDAVERAGRLLRDGFPASAIALARDVRVAPYGPFVLEAACEVWSAAALALGRPWHAAMVGEIVAYARECGTAS
jgi:hypothetical protein